MARVSDVTPLKRLRTCGPQFQWMAQELAASMSLNVAAEDFLADRCVRPRKIQGLCCLGQAHTINWQAHEAVNVSIEVNHDVVLGKFGQSNSFAQQKLLRQRLIGCLDRGVAAFR
jgi:hypothetical protein